MERAAVYMVIAGNFYLFINNQYSFFKFTLFFSPDGYRCDPKAESCTLIDPDNKIIKPFIIHDKTLNKKTSRHRIKLFQDLKSVECEDAIHYCPDTYSCCAKKYENGKKYGCCPVKNAVCCDDGINW